MNIDYFKIGARIKHHRELMGITQEELADRINATERHIRNIESGIKGTSVILLISIANALEVTPDDLLADYLTGLTKTSKAEALDLLTDCTTAEKAILMDMLRHMKKLLQEHGI